MWFLLLKTKSWDHIVLSHLIIPEERISCPGGAPLKTRAWVRAPTHMHIHAHTYILIYTRMLTHTHARAHASPDSHHPDCGVCPSPLPPHLF